MIESESFKKGDETEQKFILSLLGLGRNFKYKHASESQDIADHWDWAVKNIDTEKISLIDVKSECGIRHDSIKKFDYVWVEYANVRGDHGSINGKANYMAFLQEDYFLIVERLALRDFCDKKINFNRIVSSPKQAVYKIYMRKGKKDRISLIPKKDIIENIKCWKLKVSK